jgi:hypothetical protein
MHQSVRSRWRSLIFLTVLAAGTGWPAPNAAQTVSGQARAVLATVVTQAGISTTVLADTGALSDPTDARDASDNTGSIPSLLSGEALHAATVGGPDQVDSEASVADLALTIAGTTIGADFVMSRARATQASASSGTVNIGGLSVNGLPVFVTGDPNQTIAIPGGRVVINEQQTTAGGTVVNGLHVVVDGVADVIVASSTARVQ